MCRRSMKTTLMEDIRKYNQARCHRAIFTTLVGWLKEMELIKSDKQFNLVKVSDNREGSSDVAILNINGKMFIADVDRSYKPTDHLGTLNTRASTLYTVESLLDMFARARVSLETIQRGVTHVTLHTVHRTNDTVEIYLALEGENTSL